MAWIKRNLYFFIGSLVALGLMGYGGFFLYQQINAEQKVTAEIKELYDNYVQLSKEPSSSKSDNGGLARQQTEIARGLSGKLLGHFVSPPPIPAMARIDKRDFIRELPATVAGLVEEAQQSSVALPKDYFFTFESEKPRTSFEAGSLEKLAVRLGEIKVLCHILFSAKINALDGLKREIVSADDRNSSDFLDQKTSATTLGEITPYEVSFRCFSGELAQVMSGLADSQYCFVVKTLNVDPAPGSEAPEAMPLVAPPQSFPGGYNPSFPPGSTAPPGMNRVQPYNNQAQPPAARGGRTTILNEQPLRVTLAIELIKHKPAK